MLPIIDPLEFLDVKKEEAKDIEIEDDDYGNLKGRLLPVAETTDNPDHAQII